jgi:hypothetical protein
MAILNSPSTGHRFGRPRLLAGNPPARAAYSGNQPFQPLPSPVGPYPYHLDLASVLGDDVVAAISSAGELDFHMMGDTGGISSPIPQEDVAQAIELDIANQPDGFNPRFLYLLGDCIYYNGQEENYYAQFYDPYAHYNAPIFAIPGNHDGDPIDPSQSTLDGFLQNFCTVSPQGNPQAGDSGRTTMTQPNVYWTLDTPVATIVGLYTNVPEHGRLDDNQIGWLNQELSVAPKGKALLLTMHHPPISGDDHHGSSQYMSDLLDNSIQSSQRVPDLICAGHVHNYQRFTRQASALSAAGTIAYVVAGTGGYHNLHTMATDVSALTLPAEFPGSPDVTVDAYDDAHYGYIRVRVTPATIRLQFVQVASSPGVSPQTITPTVVDDTTIETRI